MRTTALALLAATIALSACGRNLDSATVTSGSTVGKVVYGTVVSARNVTVKDTDSAKQNALGGLAGGVAGGVAGSTIGGGSGRSLATVGGAIGGMVLGSMIEDQLSTSSGTEYVVLLDVAPHAGSNNLSTRDYRIGGGSSVSSDINRSIQLPDTASEAISVVQQDASPLGVGQRVMVIFSDDRPRVVPVAR